MCEVSPIGLTLGDLCRMAIAKRDFYRGSFGVGEEQSDDRMPCNEDALESWFGLNGYQAANDTQPTETNEGTNDEAEAKSTD